MSDTTHETETRSTNQRQESPNKKSRTYETLLNPDFAGFQKSSNFTLEILTEMKKHKKSIKILTSFNFIEKMLHYVNKNFSSSLPSKFSSSRNFLKALNQIFKNMKLENFSLKIFEMTFTYLASICAISRHGVYFTLKILVTCLKKKLEIRLDFKRFFTF